MKKKFLFLILFFLLQCFFISSVDAEEFSDQFFKNLLKIIAPEFVVRQEPFYLKTIPDIKDDLINKGSDFLEINFSQMKVRAYKKGIIEKEVPILKRGDPKNFGGTVAGLYQIVSKYNAAFSIAAQAYMPNAIKIYGKFYLHGEPYYPNGEKLISEYSGGCVQLKNKEAKEIYDLAKENELLLVIDSENKKKSFPKYTTQFPEISAPSYLVADLDSGFIFASQNLKEKRAIASLTKLMTAIVVTENVDLRKDILITPEMLDTYGTTTELIAGKKFRVIDLLYPLLIESSNDAGEALAGFLGRDITIELMNEKAKNIFMEDTKYVNPTGLSLENVSTPSDLFQMARYIFYNRQQLLEISKGKIFKNFGGIAFDLGKLYNRNIFLDNPNFKGGKTGFLIKPQNSSIFIFQFEKNKEIFNIAIILLGSENLKKDNEKIYSWWVENNLNRNDSYLLQKIISFFYGETAQKNKNFIRFFLFLHQSLKIP